MKKENLLLSIIAAFMLTSCTSNLGSNQNSQSDSNNSSQSSDVSQESSDSVQDGEKRKIATFRVSTLSDGSIIPLSYTSSGVELGLDDISLFANYITYDYSVTSKLFLKGKYGFIRNLNPLHGLNKITFKHAANYVDIYVSHDFNSTNWTKLTSKNGSFDIDNYKYFIIMAKDRDFSFTEFEISYISADKTFIHPAYVMKNIKEIKSENDVIKVTHISSEPLKNDPKWVSKGYALDLTAAQNEKMNKKQSGYEGFADYQIEYNPNLLLNTHKQSYRIADMTYGDNGNSFQINMLDGSKGPVIYKDCAYTYVEDIAAYITAFGDVPPNMQYDKNDKKSATRDWGVNGRVNYNFYHNNASGKFSFETEVPLHRYFFNPSQNRENYWYKYYESDYGADVGNTEPYQMGTEYSKDKYNNGTINQRGALRFVWSHSYTSEPHKSKTTSYIENPFDRNVFFTNNHYNDFQQYLNYYGGWSLRFGNTTIGNGWEDFDYSNHFDKAPEVLLTTLENINK